MEGGNMSSILNDVKHALGLLPADTTFDIDVIMHINSVFTTLNQLGVGPLEGFMITSDAETWDLFYEDQRLNAVKSYVFLRVKLLFDPPTIGKAFESYERQILEHEWRLNAEVDF
jgi:hypothetical protein